MHTTDFDVNKEEGGGGRYGIMKQTILYTAY